MMKIDADAIYACSEDVVSREIEGELIIVPLVAGIGDMEDELYSMNDTGKDIWSRLDGKTSLVELARALAQEYKTPPGEIEKDVLGLAEELLKRRMIVEVKKFPR